MQTNLVRRPMLSTLKQILAWMAYLVLLNTALRLYFAISNSGLFQSEAWVGILKAFGLGLRFDLSSIFIFSGVFFIFQIWFSALNAPVLLRITNRVLFLGLNFIFIGISFADLELFHLHGQRALFLNVVFAREYIKNPFALFQSYGLQAIAFVIFSASFFYLAKLMVTNPAVWGAHSLVKRIAGGVALTVLVAGSAVLFIRGGWQPKPISVVNAAQLGSSRLASLSLNTSYVLFRSRNNGLKRETFFSDERELWTALDAEPINERNSGKLKGDNVILIVLESMGREYMGWENPWSGYTPFLDELAKRGTGFSNAFANGFSSVEFPPSILAGIPSLLMNQAYIKSTYSTSPIVGLPGLFKKHGYQTAFFHGGANGTMYFDSFAGALGFDRYFGMNEYPDDLKSKDYDGVWGIFDGPYYRYFLSEINHTLNEKKTPFFFTLFTLSSHHPYTLPKGLEKKYAPGKHPMHKVVAYADEQLREFFSEAGKQPWFKDTLFVVTGDHTSVGTEPSYKNPLGRFRVPIIFFHGSHELPETDRKKFVQHIDLTATLIDLFDLERSRTPFGHSLFRDHPGFAFNRDGGTYWMANNEFALIRNDADGSETFFDLKLDPGLERPLRELQGEQKGFSNRLKATLQVFKNGLLENRLYSWPKVSAGAGDGKRN